MFDKNPRPIQIRQEDIKSNGNLLTDEQWSQFRPVYPSKQPTKAVPLPKTNRKTGNTTFSVIGDYVLYRGKEYEGEQRMLGKGDQSRVVKIAQHRNNQWVAVKIMALESESAEMPKKYMSEIEALHKMGRLRDVYRDGNKIYVFHELVHGVTLYDYYYKTTKPNDLNTTQRLTLLILFLKTLAEFDDKGYTHCDLHANNIMWDKNKKTWVFIDLGLISPLIGNQDQLEQNVPASIQDKLPKVYNEYYASIMTDKIILQDNFFKDLCASNNIPYPLSPPDPLLEAALKIQYENYAEAHKNKRPISWHDFLKNRCANIKMVGSFSRELRFLVDQVAKSAPVNTFDQDKAKTQQLAKDISRLSEMLWFFCQDYSSNGLKNTIKLLEDIHKKMPDADQPIPDHLLPAAPSEIYDSLREIPIPDPASEILQRLANIVGSKKNEKKHLLHGMAYLFMQAPRGFLQITKIINGKGDFDTKIDAILNTVNNRLRSTPILGWRDENTSLFYQGLQNLIGEYHNDKNKEKLLEEVENFRSVIEHASQMTDQKPKM